MNAKIAIPLLIVVAFIALVVGAVTGVVAAVIFGAVGLFVAVIGGIWSGMRLRSKAGGSHTVTPSNR